MAKPVIVARPRLAVTLAGALILAILPVVIASPLNLLDELTLVLCAGALAGVLGGAKWEGTVEVSAAFVCFMLAAVYVGPAAVFVSVVLTELTAWIVLGRGWIKRPYRTLVLPINIAAIAAPAVLAAVVFDLLADEMDGTAHDLVVLAGAAIGFLVLNFVLLRVLVSLLDGLDMRSMLKPPRELLPSLALTIALTLAIAGVYTELGAAASIFLILILVGFAYLSRMVVIARERTGQYAALSWGVLSSLLRSLDRRDSRTARHSAAVAAFARDIALRCAMSKRDAELAHTAGLLHDIGRFALPDRVMERHGTLTQDDWEAIHQHPELGAELLRDLGVYGPVAQIVRAHHERIDGRGYPDRLEGDEIPEIARIVAVAEVYDTLTAEDTYRDRMTSFQAITELRRVAGRQLDARFVEALAALLAGRGIEYRHADTASFDAELAIEGRIADSVATDSAAGSGGTSAVAAKPTGQ
ncbi:MAG TPA: HD domain-containing phosphohydrolase [Solirubrobacteraceae bacterium]|nr:HD domain-containing phosphohydrolase [Solirubrobacteraceae bacterium]